MMYGVECDEQGRVEWMSCRFCLSGVAKGGQELMSRERASRKCIKYYLFYKFIYSLSISQAAGGHTTQALIPDLQGSLPYVLTLRTTVLS